MKEDTLLSIWLVHQQKYPHMSIEDYVKLIHQSVYGPLHMMDHPSIDKLQSYLDYELKLMSIKKEKDIIVPIGFGYFRVDLQAVLLGLIDKEELVQAFYLSMKDSITVQTRDDVMKRCLKDLLNAIDNKQILLDNTEGKHFIAKYEKASYPAIHHSEKYKNLYHPHYRVIHRSYLTDIFQKTAYKE
ncbi:MAG: hypothetical protein WC992_07305 [Acholeplasmataceae bacterium]|jgi:hypothetical protein|nr:hypothetical protein [Acholeplasmataceae bacterium]